MWNSLVVADPCPWDEDILSSDMECSIDLVLNMGAISFKCSLRF